MREELVKAVSLPGILVQAARIERAEYRTHLGLARTVSDLKTREALLSLLRDEDTHLQMVQAHFGGAYADNQPGDAEAVPLGGAACEAIAAAEVDFLALNGCRSGLDRDLRAIRVALSIENRSCEIYRRAACESEDVSSRRLFQFLTLQEGRHIDILTARYHSLSGRVVLWAS